LKSQGHRRAGPFSAAVPPPGRNEGIQKIVRIKVSMNLGLSDSLKVLFPNVIPVQRPARAQRATVAAWAARPLFCCYIYIARPRLPFPHPPPHTCVGWGLGGGKEIPHSFPNPLPPWAPLSLSIERGVKRAGWGGERGESGAPQGKYIKKKITAGRARAPAGG